MAVVGGSDDRVELFQIDKRDRRVTTEGSSSGEEWPDGERSH